MPALAAVGAGVAVAVRLDEVNFDRTALEGILAGCAEFASSGYRVRFKNENIVAWKDGVVSVLPPDLISVVDSRTAMAISNPEFEPGRAVTVLGFPAPAIWRTPAGLRVFGPAHFGLDEAYRPL